MQLFRRREYKILKYRSKIRKRRVSKEFVELVKLQSEELDKIDIFVASSVGYVVVYSIFSVGDVFMEKSAIQNCHFSDFSKNIKKDQF